MFLFMFPDMLDAHITDKKALDKLNSDQSYRSVFDCILVGVNLVSTDCINDVAVFVASLDNERLKVVTFGDVVKAVGVYEDTSGRLV